MAESGFHRDATGLEVHVFHSFTYADATARTTASGLVADDVGKVALQSDTLAFYVLQNEVGPVWALLTGAGGGSIPTQDDGVTIVAAPTAHNFVGAGVIVTDVAGVATITISGAGLAAGNDGAVQFNDAGATGGDDRFSWDKDLDKATVHGQIEQVGGTDADLYTPTQVSATAVGANPRFAVVQANYLYICDANDNNLRIYDVTDPTAPALMSTLVIGGGRGVDIAGRFLYYGDEDNGGRLVVVDVIDVANPVVVGSIVTGGAARGVRVQGTTVFVTYNGANGPFRSFDVSDPTAPVLLDSFNTNAPGRTDFDVAGQLVILPNSSDFELIDISDPSNLASIGFMASDGHTVKIQGRYAYVGAEDNDAFEVWDIATAPAFPTMVGSLALVDPASVRAISLAGDFAYIVDASNNDMLVIDISDPTAPVAISTAVAVGLNPIAITTVGRYAYILDNNGDQFLIFDLLGIDAQNLNVGNIDAGNINLRRDLKMGGVVSAGGATFGAAGINSDGEVAANGRVLGGMPRNFVEIYRESDFPIVGSTIVLVPGVVYELRAPISTDKQIIIPDTGGAFLVAILRSSNRELNRLTSTGTGGPFVISPGSGQGQLVLQNIDVGQTGARIFSILTGNAQTQLLLELDDAVVRGFDDGSQFQNCIFNVNNASFWTGSGVFTCIDCEVNIIDAFSANFSDTGLPAFDIRSLDTVTNVPSLITVQNTKLSGQAAESFFVLHPNLIATSRILLSVISASPFTPGTGSFFGTLAAAVTGLSNSATNPGVKTTCAAAGHRYGDGDAVRLEAFATQTQYNNTFVASNVVPGVSFDVIEVFVATDTGLSEMDSIDQTDPKVTRRDCPNEKDSSTSAEAVLLANVNTTDIPAAGARVLVNGGALWTSALSERITINADGSANHIGLEPIDVIIDANLEVEPVSSTKKLSCQVLAIQAATRTVTFTNASNIINETTTPRINGDVLIFKDTTATLPAELRIDVAYFVVTQLTNSFQLSYTEGGAAIAFTDDGTPVNSYRVALLKGSMPANTIAANSPSQLIPQALVPFDSINEMHLTVSNEDDAVNIDVNQAYYRIR